MFKVIDTQMAYNRVEKLDITVRLCEEDGEFFMLRSDMPNYKVEMDEEFCQEILSEVEEQNADFESEELKMKRVLEIYVMTDFAL